MRALPPRNVRLMKLFLLVGIIKCLGALTISLAIGYSSLLTITNTEIMRGHYMGFHNTFDEYCAWCDAQCEKGLPTVSWGLWWEVIKNGDSL